MKYVSCKKWVAVFLAAALIFSLLPAVASQASAFVVQTSVVSGEDNSDELPDAGEDEGTLVAGEGLFIADEVQAAGSVTEAVYLVSQDGQQRLELKYVNFNTDAPGDQKANYAALFTSGAGITNRGDAPDQVYVKRNNVAIQVDAAGVVANVYGPVEKHPVNESVPAQWENDQSIAIPPGGYVILANDSSWNNLQHPYRKTLYTQYKIGNAVHLMRGDQIVTAADFLSPVPSFSLVVATAGGTTVASPLFTVAGLIASYSPDASLAVKVGDTSAELQPDGSFTAVVQLAEGQNTLSVSLLQDAVELEKKELTVTYLKPAEDYIEVEAAPEDITINVEGPRKKIDYIDEDVTGIDNIIALYTGEYGDSIAIPQYNVAVQVGADSKVIQVVNPSVNGVPPVWSGPTELEIPQGGYVLYAQDNSYANHDIKRFLAEKFKAGDVIKLRKNGEVVPVRELMTGKVKLTVDNYQMVTVTADRQLISGRVDNAEDLTELQVFLNDTQVPLQADGSFSYDYPLASGINYVEVQVRRGDNEETGKDLVIFSRPGFASDKGVILWVDQAANARKFQTSKNVYDFLKKAKDSGVTEVAFDVKGVEGFASYKRNDLTGRPYVSEIKAASKAGSNPDLDLLQEFIDHGHALGLKIHAAINVFAEGSIASNEFAVLNDHLDWEERVHAAENNNQIKRLRESAKQGLVAFVNPSNDEVREYELKTFEEVIKNYDVDGVIHDRGRYDNETADFSDVTREKFETFLAERDKELVNWPDDIFRYEGNTRVYGPLIQDWWEFRSATIKSFFGEVKELVDSYEADLDREIQVSVYVGSWYETYYLNGVNWASPNFRYDARLGLKEESVYTPYYYETGYIEHLDFIMIGAYQTTGQEVEKYITLGNIVTNGEIPLYAGIALNNVQEPALQREVFQSGLNNTNGLMLFDASQINWSVAAAALKDEEYVKDYQLGISLPGSPDSFLEGNHYNVNLVEGNINAFTDSFGYSTGTSRYGVEVVVEPDGMVSRVANRNQAINWSWGTPEENNSVIPEGGFVLSTVDPSGIRTMRQLVANAYRTGDSVRAALLSGYLSYEGLETSQSLLPVKGNVQVLGTGRPAVTVAGVEAPVETNGDFSVQVPLVMGDNTVTIAVYVDEYKTNEKMLSIVRKEASSGGGSGGAGYIGIPAVKELVEVTEEAGEDGLIRSLARVSLEQLLLAIDKLAEKEASGEGSQVPTLEVGEVKDGLVLQLPVGEVKDGFLLQLPVAGVQAALEQLPWAAFAIESSLGRLELPVQSLAELATAAAEGELHIALGVVSETVYEGIAEGLGAKGATEVAKAIAVDLFVVSGESEHELALAQGSYGLLHLPLAGKVAGEEGTVLEYDAAKGTLRFVPARFVDDGAASARAEARIRQSGVFAVAQGSPGFADLSGHWAAGDVALLSSKWIVEGRAAQGFVPDAPLTRAELAALLVRSLGLKPSYAESGLKDVAATDWFAPEVTAAVEAGLVEGYENGEFRGGELLTREQLGVMLFRALQAVGAGTASGGSGDSGSEGSGLVLLERLEDRGRLATWSEAAIAGVLEAGLMEGRTEGTFDPQASTTRAEGAVVVKRLLQHIGYID